MSCDVMYQSHYSHFPYQRNILPQVNKQLQSAQALSQDASELSDTDNISQSLPAASVGGSGTNIRRNDYPSVTCTATSSPGIKQPLPPPLVKGERQEREAPSSPTTRSAQYVSANCVIFTYFEEDIAKVVDEHFRKALSQANDRDYIPLSARQLPPSFWDSNWVSPVAASPVSAADQQAYLEYNQEQGWHNYMMGGRYSAHQMYSSYSSLLLQHNYHAHQYSGVHGLDGRMQGSSGKELYWF